MKGLRNQLICILAMLTFLVGLLIPTDKEPASLALVVFIFPLTFSIMLLAFLLERISLKLGRKFAEIFGRRVCPNEAGYLARNLKIERIFAGNFVSLGAGSMVRTLVWKDESFLVGSACFALAAGLLAAIGAIGFIQRRGTALGNQS
jgi:hypothetical protein